MTVEQFHRVDGMSNQYWGWGLEDDELYLRLREARLPLFRPVNLTTNVSNTFEHVHDRRLRQRDMLRIGEQRNVRIWNFLKTILFFLI